MFRCKLVLDKRKGRLDKLELEFRKLKSRICSFRSKTKEEEEEIGNLWTELLALGYSLAEETLFTNIRCELLLMEKLSDRYPKESSRTTHFGEDQQQALRIKIDGTQTSNSPSVFQCLSISFDKQDTELKERFTSRLSDVTHRLDRLLAPHKKSAGVGVHATRS